MADTRSKMQSVADSNEELTGALQGLEARHRLLVSAALSLVRLRVLTV